LAESVIVDFRESQSLARRLLKDKVHDEADFGPAATAALSAELLPEWYDDWVITEAEDWRQLRTTALEAQAGWLTAAGRYADAAGAARAAMKAEPLRESAHACLVRVHLAEGNQSEAFRALDHFESILNDELGLKPTSNLTNLFTDVERLNSGGPSPRGTSSDDGLGQPA
jgi:DNA-binding SARP family transcriptional activator